jgi:hypothetical protein
VVGIELLYILISRPHFESRRIDGTYTNSCCYAVVIHDGVLAYGDTKTPITIQQMKFGVAGYPKQPFGPFYVQYRNTHDRIPPQLLFSDDLQTFRAVDFRGQEYVFDRVD